MVVDREEFNGRLGERLRGMRQDAGYRSAASFAAACGLGAGYADYEKGRATLPLDKACAIADTLGCSLDELAGRAAAPADERELLDGYRSLGLRDRQSARAMVRGLAAASEEEGRAGASSDALAV